MIYFESFKLENNPYKNYGLTWEINKENIVIVTTDNNEYTKSLFNFLKNREKYEHGRCFIDDIDITNLSSENYNNFKFNNFIFLDNDLIINPKWNFRKISKIYKSLINPNIHLNNLFNIPFSKLNVIDKLKIWFSLVPNNKQKYIFINLLDNKFNNNEIKQIYDLCSNQATSLGKQIIVFINNEVNDSNIVININKKYFYNNQTLTISKEEYHFNKYSIIDKKIFFKIFFRLTIWEFILFSLSGLILGIICFFIFSVQFIINDVNNPISLLEFISKNRILWNFLGVLIYILLVLNIFLCFWIINKKNKKYLSFTNCFGFNNKTTIINTTIIFYGLLIFFVLVSNLVTYGIISKISNNLKQYWFMINIFASILLLLFTGIFIVININNKITASIVKINTIKILL